MSSTRRELKALQLVLKFFRYLLSQEQFFGKQIIIIANQYYRMVEQNRIDNH